MRVIKILATKPINGNTMGVSIIFDDPVHAVLSSSNVFTDMTFFGVSKEELEYISSELKRIADSME